MSAEESLRVAQMNFRAMNTHDLDRYAETLDEAIVMESDAFPAPVTGREAAGHVMQSYYTAFPDLHFEVEREIASGEYTAVCWRATGTHQGDLNGIPPTNRQVQFHGCSVVQIQEGKIVHSWVYSDTLVLMQQLGVIPIPGQTST